MGRGTVSKPQRVGSKVTMGNSDERIKKSADVRWAHPPREGGYLFGNSRPSLIICSGAVLNPKATSEE